MNLFRRLPVQPVFAQDNHRQQIAAVDPLRAPIENFLGSISGNINRFSTSPSQSTNVPARPTAMISLTIA